ncbi:MAG: hypothetical protein ACI90U_000122 [Pseudomonadales bacterium]|jgi:hypothetical protein
MKNNLSGIALKFAISFVAGISLWSQLTLASSTEDLNALVDLLDERGISISTNPSALSGEKNVVVISRGPLTDTQVAVYNDKYDGQLLLLPLTTKLLDESIINDDEEEVTQERDKLFATALTQGTMVYLYINPSHFKNSATTLSDMLTPLLASDFQDKLNDSRFAALPAEYIQQWAVSLGNAEPEYAGGYK